MRGLLDRVHVVGKRPGGTEDVYLGEDEWQIRLHTLVYTAHNES